MKEAGSGEIQTNMNTRRAEEIGTRLEIWRLWQTVKKAIQKKTECRVQPLCKSSLTTERDIQWFLNATQAMIKNIDKEAAERRIQIWSDRMKRVLNRKTKATSVSNDWKTLSNFNKKGRAPPISAVLIPNREEQTGGVESTQKKHAVETEDILQQIEKQWEPTSETS